MTPYVAIALPDKQTWIPMKLPGATRTYALDVAAFIRPEDIFQQITVQAAPSGAGELALSDLSAIGDTMYFTTSAGVSTRIYTLKFIVTCFTDQVYEFLVYQGVPRELPGYSVPVAPSPGFGAAVVWDQIVDFDFTDPLNSGYIAFFAGI